MSIKKSRAMRTVFFVLLIPCLVFIAACGNEESTLPATPPSSQENGGGSVDDSAQSQEDCSLDMLIDTEYYTIKVPNSWDDDCFYEVANGESYNYTLSFYHKASHEQSNDGWLFSIRLLTAFEDYTYYPDYDVLGSLEVYRTGSYNMIVIYPTDVQFSEETAKKYNEMSNLIPDILSTISFKDECVFSEEPLPVETTGAHPIDSRANGSWSHTISMTESQNLIIRSDGTFVMTYNFCGEVKELLTGNYEIISDDGQYEQFRFFSLSGDYDSWCAKIFQTRFADQYGTQYDGIEYISENGDILYYTGTKYLD